MDEYDYIDIAVDTLRNIKHFGATEYVATLLEILLEKHIFHVILTP
jgi:hypothetical protein